MSANKLIAFGVPWNALGPGSMWSDSGFLLVYEMLKKMHELFGTVGLMPMDPRYREMFNERNDHDRQGTLQRMRLLCKCLSARTYCH